MEFNLQKVDSFSAILADWVDLFPRSGAGIFLCPEWVGGWFNASPKSRSKWLLRATENGRVIGLAIFSVEKVAGAQIWTLNGDWKEGQPYFEGNDFLVAAEGGERTRREMLAFWQVNTGRAAEMRLPGVDPEVWNDLGVDMDLSEKGVNKTASLIDLVAVRKSTSYLAMISKHTLRIIKRSMRAYNETLGELVAQRASSLEEARDWFRDMVALHAQRWDSKGKPSGFSTPQALAFHRRLMTKLWSKDGIEMVRVMAGSAVVGYVYAITDGKRLSVYQSGLQFGLMKSHDKPGLVVHAMAIQIFADLGFDCYDLFGGSYQYKESLRTDTREVSWLVLSKPSMRVLVSQSIRRNLGRFRAVIDSVASSATPSYACCL